MKRIISILFIAFSLIIANGNLEVQAQPTISNNGMFYRILAENGLLNNVQAFWEFDETAGLTAFDETDNNYDGTITGPSINQTGKLDRSYLYDGNNDYVTFSSAPNLANISFSISAWFNVTSLSANGDIFSQGTNANNQGLQLRVLSTGYIRFGFFFDDVDSNSTISTGNWYLVVVTYNSTTNLQTIYINGSEDNTRTATNDFSGSGTAMTGTTEWNLLNDFNGYIDQTGIWARELTYIDVSNLYSSGNGIYYIDFTTSLNKMYDNLIPLQFKPLDIETPLRIAS